MSKFGQDAPREPQAGGTVADKYRLEKLIARGGMGTVWLAIDSDLERPVAIKFMDPRIAANKELRERFNREAKAAARLRTPHVVQIYETGIEQGVPFIVMEMLEGEDLHTRLKREAPLPLGATAKIVKQIAKGLKSAQDANVIHRDLKPQNVFLSLQDGDLTVKLLDFGVAKIRAAATSADETKAGTVLGSPHYMSPEQARGRPDIDHRADVWSLAVITFRAVTGKLAFPGDAPGEVILKICTDPIPVPSHRRADLPADVDEFFALALERDPEKRFQTAPEFAAAFDHLVKRLALQRPAAMAAPGPMAGMGYAPGPYGAAPGGQHPAAGGHAPGPGYGAAAGQAPPWQQPGAPAAQANQQAAVGMWQGQGQPSPHGPAGQVHGQAAVAQQAHAMPHPASTGVTQATPAGTPHSDIHPVGPEGGAPESTRMPVPGPADGPKRGGAAAQPTDDAHDSPLPAAPEAALGTPMPASSGTPMPLSGTPLPASSGTPMPLSGTPLPASSGTPMPLSGTPMPLSGTPLPASSGTPMPLSGTPLPASGMSMSSSDSPLPAKPDDGQPGLAPPDGPPPAPGSDAGGPKPAEIAPPGELAPPSDEVPPLPPPRAPAPLPSVGGIVGIAAAADEPSRPEPEVEPEANASAGAIEPIPLLEVHEAHMDEALLSVPLSKQPAALGALAAGALLLVFIVLLIMWGSPDEPEETSSVNAPIPSFIGQDAGERAADAGLQPQEPPADASQPPATSATASTTAEPDAGKKKPVIRYRRPESDWGY